MARPNIALDLGTANTRIYECQKGIIEQPSLVSSIRQNKNGQKSDAYIAYLNSRLFLSPLSRGVIVDIGTAVRLLSPMFKKVRKGLKHPVLLACAPTDTSEKERSLLTEAVLRSGALRVAIIPEPWAAAIGAGIDLTKPRAQLLIDIGEGVTDMAAVRDGRLICTAAERIGCSDIHKAIRTAIISQHKVYLYPSEIEKLTHEIDSGTEPESPRIIAMNGIHIAKRREVSVEVSSTEVIRAAEPVISKILKMIGTALQNFPEDIFREASGSGICLTGGGSCIKGMNRLISMKTGLNAKLAPDPVHAVINGAIQLLEHWKGKECWWEKIGWSALN
jgi:rod shape-determining protein MreB